MNEETPARRETEDAGGDRGAESLPAGDDRVAAHLLKHPDFFARHPEVLAALDLAHDASGAASLLEKQIAVLREKNRDAETGREELIKTARTNMNLSISLHKTALELLRAGAGAHRARAVKAGEVARACKAVFREHVPEVRLFIYWCSGFLAGDGGGSNDDVVLDERDPRIAGLLESLFTLKTSAEPFSEPARAALFGRLASTVRSTVAAALSEPVTQRRMGILVVASGGEERFAPGQGTMFLVQLVQLIEHAFHPASETGDEAPTCRPV